MEQRHLTRPEHGQRDTSQSDKECQRGPEAPVIQRLVEGRATVAPQGHAGLFEMVERSGERIDPQALGTTAIAERRRELVRHRAWMQSRLAEAHRSRRPLRESDQAAGEVVVAFARAHGDLLDAQMIVHPKQADCGKRAGLAVDDEGCAIVRFRRRPQTGGESLKGGRVGRNGAADDVKEDTIWGHAGCMLRQMPASVQKARSDLLRRQDLLRNRPAYLHDVREQLVWGLKTSPSTLSGDMSSVCCCASS